jgi:hypothetical protein
METLITCKQCGSQNRVGDVPRGKKAVCGSCRSVLGSIETTRPPKPSGKLSGTAWAWVIILVIGLVAWMAESSRSDKRKVSAESSSLQPQPPKSHPQDISSRQLNEFYKELLPQFSRSNPQKYSSSSSRQTPSPPQRPVFTEPEQALPPHGKITRYSNGEPVAPLEIRSSRGSNYVVKLSDYYSGRAVLSVFVHGGSTANLDVPLGTYSIKYASGEHWYGPTHLFGPDTAYSKADSSFDFRVTGNQVSGYTLTLYKVVDGNLQTTAISPNEF